VSTPSLNDPHPPSRHCHCAECDYYFQPAYEEFEAMEKQRDEFEVLATNLGVKDFERSEDGFRNPHVQEKYIYWQAGRASNRTPASNVAESNEHKPSALPLGDAGKLVEALREVREFTEIHGITGATDIIDEALSTHLAGTSKGDVTP
jgi:Xaa-Pro aminopeptidase